MLHKRVGGRGAELFLLHGWGMNAAVWERLAAALSESFRVTVADLPGHGRSPYGLDGSIGAWVDACLEVAPEEAVWVGWSLGGSLALEAALRSPPRLRALVLVSTTPCFVRGPGWSHAVPAAILERFREALAGDPATTLERFLALQVKGGEDARPQLRRLRSFLAGQPVAQRSALDDGLRLLLETDLRPRLAELALPSLWLLGDRDTLVPWRWSEALPRLLPEARRELIRGASHAPFLSHLEQCADLLNGFVNELP